jgi:hypothetical protein
VTGGALKLVGKVILFAAWTALLAAILLWASLYSSLD